jgi:hypothetical protein
MAKARDGGFWARCVRFSVAAIVAAALFGARSVVHAACTNCTNVRTGSLASVTDASDDSAFGFNALNADSSGSENTATGAFALKHNSGYYNTAAGAFALEENGGNANTATGLNALLNNTTGGDNTATGFDALVRNTTGSGNTATGDESLVNTTGSNNIAVGFYAGDNLTTGDNNIDIGNEGVGRESDTIRIGTQGTQTATFIAGIFPTNLRSSAIPVLVDRNGQLGTIPSSARFKRDIRATQRAAEAGWADQSARQAAAAAGRCAQEKECTNRRAGRANQRARAPSPAGRVGAPGGRDALACGPINKSGMLRLSS